MLIDPSI